MSSKEHVIEAALKLSEDERLEVAERLYESVEHPDAELDAGLDEMWAKEIERRIKSVDSGETKPIPWEEARRQMMEDDDERQVP
jgi:putative addiction module component (TIGR02574 family)